MNFMNAPYRDKEKLSVVFVRFRAACGSMPVMGPWTSVAASSLSKLLLSSANLYGPFAVPEI
jgi:hypothetical protein